MGALGLGPDTVLLGHSFGSIVASHYVAAHPGTVSELILVNPIAALLPLVELGRGEKPGACEAALADLRRIAPPEPQARERPGRRRE